MSFTPSWYAEVPCPTCGAGTGERCRTSGDLASAAPHTARCSARLVAMQPKAALTGLWRLWQGPGKYAGPFTWDELLAATTTVRRAA